MEQTQKKKTFEAVFTRCLAAHVYMLEGEFRERAVRLAMEHRDEYQSEAAALTAIAAKLGCSSDSRSGLDAPNPA